MDRFFQEHPLEALSRSGSTVTPVETMLPTDVPGRIYPSLPGDLRTIPEWIDSSRNIRWKHCLDRVARLRPSRQCFQRMFREESIHRCQAICERFRNG